MQANALSLLTKITVLLCPHNHKKGTGQRNSRTSHALSVSDPEERTCLRAGMSFLHLTSSSNYRKGQSHHLACTKRVKPSPRTPEDFQQRSLPAKHNTSTPLGSKPTKFSFFFFLPSFLISKQLNPIGQCNLRNFASFYCFHYSL